MHKRCIKAQYDKNVQPRIYSKGDLVLLYDQETDVIGTGKFEPLWHGPYIFKCILAKGAYDLVDYDGIPLSQPQNGLYLKCYYLQFCVVNTILYALIVCVAVCPLEFFMW